MSKILNYKFQITNKFQYLKFKSSVSVFFLLVFLTFHFSLFTFNAYAVESTPSADLKSKLKSLQDQIASKAVDLKTTISTKLQNKTYFGKVLSKTDSTLTLATRTGSKIVSVNQDIVYSYSKGKLSLKTISIDDFIVGLGDIDENGVLSARKIIKSTLVEFPDLKTSWGVVTNLSDAQFNIQTGVGEDIIFFTDNKTELRFGEVTADFSDIKLKKSVITVGLPYKTGIKPRFIYILPYTSVNLKTSPTASPSSVPTSSPSATLKKPTPIPVKK